MCSSETKQFAAVRHMMKESMRNPNGITVGRAYDIAVNYLGNEDEAVDLLTSDKCMFSQSEINTLKYKRDYNKNYRSQKQSKALNQVHAF